MEKFNFLKTCLVLGFIAVGMTFFNTSTAHAVADVSISVNDSGQSLGGATVSITSLSTGTTETYNDDDDDGRIGFILRGSGRHRITITTADGRSSSTTFDAPEDGAVTIDYDVSRGSPRVSVNDTSSRSGTVGSPWSVNLLFTAGFGDWQGQFDNGGSFSEGETENIRKYGAGLGLRYQMPNYPLFLMTNFFYHGRGRTSKPFQSSGGFDLEIRERWKWQMMAGWTFYSTETFAWSIMAGITLARIRMNILSGGSLQADESEVQVAPTFGSELQWSLNQARSVFLVVGMTAAIMNSISHNISGTNQFLRADNDLQWDSYIGLRIPF